MLQTMLSFVFASRFVRVVSSAGRLRSTGITPSHRYFAPIRHPLAFDPLPGVAGYRVYLPPILSCRGETGFSSCLTYPLCTCCRYHPAKVFDRIGQISIKPAAFAHGPRAQPSRFRVFGATYAFTFVTACTLTISLSETLSIGFRILVSRHPAIQVTGLLTFTPAGLSPAEYASLSRTHGSNPHLLQSGNSSTLLHRRPLRTVLAAFAAHGSSLGKGTLRHPTTPLC